MKKCFSAAGAVIFCLSVLLTGCANSADGDPEPVKTGQEEGQQGGQEGNGGSQGGSQQGEGQQGGQEGGQQGGDEQPRDDVDENPSVNPDYGLSRAENLDWIFNNTNLGTTTVRIKRSEWKTLCDDYRYFYKNENCVHAESYTYEKDGHKWELKKGIGFRLRGNTSRYCPQGYDNGNIQGQMNKDWNSGYYTYANQPNDDYRQTHFKIDFEEFLSDDDEQKMAGCMKGVALKRMDESCTREIFCYDLFRKNGIWTAPRASHTRLILEIVEDDNSVTKVDYGVYEMFEEVNKQSLKARESGKNNNAKNAWKNNKGNLWKCGNPLTSDRMTSNDIGVEDIRIIKKGEEMPAGAETNGREDETRKGYIWKGYSLDLKTNKENFESASSEIVNFITELNGLPEVSGASDTSSINTIKTFYEKWFDVDFFLKTYAINILCGMDDDYWANANNYYLYFDTGKGGSGKLYFIPFDYDNTLGHSINGDGDGTRHNPMDWGRGKDRPLMDKLLSVPEYKEKFKELLLELCQNDYFKFERCSQMFLDWGTMVSPYINSPDLCYTGLGVNQFADWNTWNQSGCSLTNKANNIFDDTRRSIIYNLTGEEVDDGQLIIYQDSSYTGEGFKIKIKNIPANAASREIYINGKHVSSIERDWSYDRRPYDNISAYIFDDEWVYPYTVSGKKYDVSVKYIDKYYSTIESSRKKTVTANGGLGELSANTFNYFVSDDNKLKFNPAPAMKIGNSSLESDTGYYRLETTKASGEWIENKTIGQSVSEVDLNDYFPRDLGITKDTVFKFKLYYEIPNSRGDKYRYVILDFDDTKNENLKLAEDFPVQVEVLESSESNPGLNIKFNEIPSNAYSREIYLDNVKVSDLERSYAPESPNAHIGDEIWHYPYVVPGKHYILRVKYIGLNWDTLLDTELEVIGDSTGYGEISVPDKNTIAYKVENNKLVFTNPPKISVGENIYSEFPENGPAYCKLTVYRASDNAWLCDENIYNLDQIEVDLTRIGNGNRPISTTEKLCFNLVFRMSVLNDGIDCRYEIFSRDEIKNKGGILLNEELTVQ